MQGSGIKTGDFFYDARVFLELFDRSLRADSYSRRTCRQHWDNIIDYLDYYLSIGEERDISEWCAELDDFIRNGFFEMDRPISESQLSSMCVSMRRFYQCMRDNAVITWAEYDRVRAALRENRDKWFEARQKREEAMGEPTKYRRQPRLIYELEPQRREDDDEDYGCTVFIGENSCGAW